MRSSSSSTSAAIDELNKTTDPYFAAWVADNADSLRRRALDILLAQISSELGEAYKRALRRISAAPHIARCIDCLEGRDCAYRDLADIDTAPGEFTRSAARGREMHQRASAKAAPLAPIAASATKSLLTIEEVSELTRVAVNTLRYWRHQGTGPASARMGKRIVYRATDVRAWVDGQFAVNRPGEDS